MCCDGRESGKHLPSIVVLGHSVCWIPLPDCVPQPVLPLRRASFFGSLTAVSRIIALALHLLSNRLRFCNVGSILLGSMFCIAVVAPNPTILKDLATVLAGVLDG